MPRGRSLSCHNYFLTIKKIAFQNVRIEMKVVLDNYCCWGDKNWLCKLLENENDQNKALHIVMTQQWDEIVCRIRTIMRALDFSFEDDCLWFIDRHILPTEKKQLEVLWITLFFSHKFQTFNQLLHKDLSPRAVSSSERFTKTLCSHILLSFYHFTRIITWLSNQYRYCKSEMPYKKVWNPQNSPLIPLYTAM